MLECLHEQLSDITSAFEGDFTIFKSTIFPMISESRSALSASFSCFHTGNANGSHLVVAKLVSLYSSNKGGLVQLQKQGSLRAGNKSKLIACSGSRFDDDKPIVTRVAYGVAGSSQQRISMAYNGSIVINENSDLTGHVDNG
eukprot:scaffold46632_cov67-Attheya_sp.AAC.4